LNTEDLLDEDVNESEFDEGADGGFSALSSLALISRYWSSQLTRVKRRIWFNNETLPIPPEAAAAAGNGSGNSTKPKGYSIIKLLNKNYTLIKEKYLAALAAKAAGNLTGNSTAGNGTAAGNSTAVGTPVGGATTPAADAATPAAP
jgi:hypothetical protein